jgi:hypothetical protein
MAERVGVAGMPAECVRVFRRLLDDGLQYPRLHPYPEFLGQLELLSSEVAPQLQDWTYGSHDAAPSAIRRLL